jgi:hypothetical protein
MRVRLASHVSAIALAAVATFGLASVDSAQAAGIVFTFNSLTDTSNNAAITAYMDSVVKAANAAYGAVSLNATVACPGCGAEGETNYTGDNHVVGLTVTNGTAGQLPATPVGGGTYQLLSNGVIPLTLGNTDGFTEPNGSSGLAQMGNANPYSPNGKVGHLTTLDAFITNDVNNSSPDKTTIGLQFSGFTFQSIEFDFQIFPDASCTTAGCTSGLPDLTLKYKDSNGVMQTVHQFLGETPDGDTHSPISGKTGTELTPQLLSHALFNLPEATNEVWFVDWPRTIGVDNVCLDCGPPRTNAPEPMSLAIFGVGLAGLVIPMWLRRRRTYATI